ncbi:MAG TPA: 16S rRNA (cytosine(967)-C(5))-methyltransferase RsmB [Ignavibacteriales bacterium]|nr:16S rRNA (cytosine(967)-C(5))-methyltransferase RsmB [Ignavibacteriales bacterium]HOL81392.1 16S rRNA (cytosine(967)-C(5))-methyltransferase RsmB [Ignavibacteriales bacterium]HOM65507.1 16S rRNA (cytosine(967)-C(5))-methyltransferase RsmB [Ignavibacteriales bacterium]HPD67752.1 16S rRNA (cytosine(967)-C(5))-methyltransferase RsmB [Ignavibacteriales bacterium]HPP33839.1 16S rRNA (cytosine(967)-C(5))-methyltransferase RsmB [Ignavibacteriales bacterium]
MQEELFYSGVRGIAVKILNRIEQTDAYLDKILDYELKHSNLSSQDKALLYEIVHGVVRWEGKLDWILTGFMKGNFSKAMLDIKNALRVALYQILYLDKIPHYAALNEATEFIKKIHGQKYANFVNALLRNIVNNLENIRFPDPEEKISYLTNTYSHPVWLVKKYLTMYEPDEIIKIMLANNEKPKITLRVNRLVVNDDEFEKIMQNDDIEYVKTNYIKGFYQLKSLINIKNWKYFKEGYCNIQDESTGLSVNILDAKEGMRVLDMCAAPGGKTAYIAEKMKNTGEIVALDKFETRLNVLMTNLNRLKVTNVKPVVGDAATYDECTFDRILLDAPCSGLGTLSKKPDIKWKRTYSDILRLIDIQEKLLNNAAKLLKPSGILVYSTCTTIPDENDDVINKFLKNHPEFSIEKPDNIPSELVDDNGFVKTFPHIHRIDGSFCVKLRKNSE